jgi:hypothetical protein
MASFNLQWRASTRKDLRGIPREDISRIVAAVAKLADDQLPHGSQKLAGSERTYAFGSAITESCTNSFATRNSWRSSAYDIAKMFTDNIEQACATS